MRQLLGGLSSLGIALLFVSRGMYLPSLFFALSAAVNLLFFYQRHKVARSVDFLATQAEVAPPIQLEPELEEAIRIIAASSKIEAIKEVRRLSGANLKAAKDYVESL